MKKNNNSSYMKSSEDELISHIKGSLAAHEEEYVPGAWEKFNEKERKHRGLIFWIGSLSSVAAVLLVGIVIAFYVNRNPVLKQVETVKIGTETKSPQNLGITGKENLESAEVADPIQTAVKNTQETPQDNQPLNIVTARRASTTFSIEKVTTPSVQKTGDFSQQTPESLNSGIGVPGKLQHTEVQSAIIAKIQSPTAADKRSFEEFLNDESRRNQSSNVQANVAKKQSKWEMGLVVAPSFGNSKRLNMGYGVSMGYALSDKVSISSGASYSEMGASKVVSSGGQSSPATMSMMVTSGGRSLQSIDANLQGIDIPLEIKYHVSKRVYANVGISAFAVLNQTQKNNFLEQSLEIDPAVPLSSNAAAYRTTAVSRKVTEVVPEDEVKNDSYLGFYNFSLGYQQKISGGKAFSVEPFLKLPIKEFTKENLYLIGTGVKLRFDF